ncbi:MAG: helix-turn-helix domain-containing protein [Selenomonadaceae bacterium]|nr:helix-turn-helix domain-containing protein [Selenomonadaceae bacterium]
MHEKDTEELVEELKISPSIKKFIKQNQDEFKVPLYQYLNQLLAERNLSKSDLVEKINSDDKHIYHILSGLRNPSRKKLLTIARALELDLDETNYLLRYGGFAILYVRDVWDSIIIRAIEKNLTIMETNHILHQLNQPLLNAYHKDDAV